MIFCFSGTGNTKWVAETIANATSDRIVNIANKTYWHADCHLAVGEPIGFCFPVHGWQPPKIVREFVKSLNIDDASNRYCYVVCTCGDSIGKAMNLFRKDLSAKGFTLHSAFSLIMPESYVCLPFMYTDTKEREKEKISQASEQLNGIIETIKSRRQGINNLVEGYFPWIQTHVVGGFFNKFMITDKPFCVDKSLCQHCGLCKKVCPVANVSYDSDGLPLWKCDGTCTNCLACYHHCPVHAINYRAITKKRGQYYFGKK